MIPARQRMSRMVGAAALAVVAAAPYLVWNPYHLHTLIMAGIFAVLALSLNLLLGYTGQLSLGHAAFFGIGAYASGLLTVKLEWSPWLGLLAAATLPAATGWIIGRLALKLRGAYFVLLTISFVGVVSLVSLNWMDLTNGPLGLPGIPPVEIGLPGLHPLSLKAKDAYYYLVLAAVISAAMAGLAGGLYAHYTRFVSPEVFLFSYTVTMVIMVIAGGQGTLAGPVVGALLFTVLPAALACSSSRISASSSAAWSRWRACRSACSPARSRASSAPTARARRRRSTRSPAICGRPAAASRGRASRSPGGGPATSRGAASCARSSARACSRP